MIKCKNTSINLVTIRYFHELIGENTHHMKTHRKNEIDYL